MRSNSRNRFGSCEECRTIVSDSRSRSSNKSQCQQKCQNISSRQGSSRSLQNKCQRLCKLVYRGGPRCNAYPACTVEGFCNSNPANNAYRKCDLGNGNRSSCPRQPLGCNTRGRRVECNYNNNRNRSCQYDSFACANSAGFRDRHCYTI